MRLIKSVPLTLILLVLSSSSSLAAGVATGNIEGGNYTQSDVILLIAYVLLALVFSFTCSVAEAALLSITPSFIANKEKDRPKLAALLKKLRQDNIDQSLAAILTLNTIAHTVGAIGSGSKATAVFGSAWFGLFSAVMTLLILFLSEIIPKTIGAVYWRSLSGLTARFIQTLIFLLYPLIWISEKLTKLVSGGKKMHAFNRDEFIALADIGEKSGHLDKSESRIINNLFKLDSLTAEDVMTPRTVVFAMAKDQSINEAFKAIADLPFTRIPLYKETLDDIKSFVLKPDILYAKAKDEDEIRLETLERELHNVPEDMQLSDLLELFLKNRYHITIVSDKFGGTSGVVTLEDIVETLLGTEIVDEMDTTEDMQQMARKLWENRAKSMGLETDKNQKEIT